MINTKILFSEYFDVTKEELADFDVFDISLFYDSPVFIDPFLLFYSEDEQHQALHKYILDYFSFLKDISDNHPKSDMLVKEFFLFSEEKELWLGFSAFGNQGKGPGIKFGRALFDNLKKLSLFDGTQPTITSSEHIEKLTLLDPRIGKDCISDLTATLIKSYLLEYTQEFSQKFLKDVQCEDFNVLRAHFNPKSGLLGNGLWESKKYYLPRHPFKANEYIILTPKSIFKLPPIV